MKRVSDPNAATFQKTILKGSIASAAPGIAALVAALTAPPSILNQYIGLGQVGCAAIGVLFFIASFLFSRGRWWAAIPAFACAGWALFAFSIKAARLLLLYYEHNPLVTLNDLFAPFPIISLQLTLMLIASTICYIIFKAIRLSKSLAPQTVNLFVWGALGLWLSLAVLDSLQMFQQ